VSVAKQIGIVHSADPTIITGTDLDGMDDQLLRNSLKNEDVIFARV
jgi:magnesium-transporting ATPase (P-type)